MIKFSFRRIANFKFVVDFADQVFPIKHKKFDKFLNDLSKEIFNGIVHCGFSASFVKFQ